MWHLTVHKISVSLLLLSWLKNETIFYCVTELMLAALIQRSHKNHFISRTRDKMKFYRLSDATFYDCINAINQFNKLLLNNKMSIFEEYGAFKHAELFISLREMDTFSGEAAC